ncbi:Na/Pi cotransporter family protein [Roseovarius sp. D22-M7]|uniref:Na/Pi cotransporter family protein n=1 Tax=Roseovarius sp. D22-M7 TaxID=3127116 RepID=UPI00300FC8F9
MQSLAVLISIGGAVALLLFALRLVRDGVTDAFGLRLKLALGHGTRTAPRAFLSGMIATLGLQSSTATALMTSGFVERDMIAQGRAQIVLLGANLGTALTALIVTAGIEALAPVLLLLGYVLYRQTPRVVSGIGRALIGIGLVLLSLTLLTQATAPLRDSAALTAFLGLLGDAWPVAFAVSAALAALFSSSLAMVMLIVSLGLTGGLDPALAVVLVLGANFGGAIPPVLATLAASPAAHRVTLGNLMVRGLGCLLALPFAAMIGRELEAVTWLAGGLPVEAHLAFNLALAVLIWPLAGLLARALPLAVPDPPAEAGDGPRWLDEAALDHPEVALAGASREALELGDTVERMLQLIMTAFRDNDPAALREIARLEERVDRLQQEVKLYLSRLGAGASKRDKRRTITVLDYIINLEHAGDIIEKGLAVQVDRKISLGLWFSAEGYRELEALFDLTLDTMKIAQTIFMTPDRGLAKQLIETKVRIRHMERRSPERHFRRLRKGHTDSLQTSSLHLDMLRDLKRVSAHLISVAHPILDEEGMLVESRLKDTAEG